MSASCAISTESSSTTRSRAPVSLSSTVVASAASPVGASSDRCDPPASVVRSLAELREPEEHLPHERPLPFAATCVDLLGRVCDRTLHASGRAVADERQDATVATRPRLVQSVREERERAGLALDVRQHGVDQACLESEPGCSGGALDRPAKLLGLHRAEQVLVLGHRGGEARMLRAASVEVRPQGDDERDAVRRGGRTGRRGTPLDGRPDRA